jgi:soluble lytic murein transglycosylase
LSGRVNNLIAIAVLAGLLGFAASAYAASKPAKTVPLPRPRPTLAAAQSDAARTPRTTAAHTRPLSLTPPAASAPAAPAIPLAMAPTATTSPADLAAVRQAIEQARRGRTAEATEIQKAISDPLARKLVEWVILRSDDNDVDFARYARFIAGNPSWPSLGMLRRRAESMLWHENADSALVRAFFAGARPLGPKGRFALARALLAQGDRAGAAALVREAWRRDALTRDLESDAREHFAEFITRADDKERMDRRLYAEDTDAALRAAHRLGGVEAAIAKARVAVNGKKSNAKALLEAVPAQARHDAGYLFSRIQWLRRNDKIEEAARLMLSAPRDPAHIHDLDEWWVERRLVARELLDRGDFHKAYQIARAAAPPTKENYRVEHEFTAGWIALRFLNDPATAAQHFARISAGVTNPIALARAGYWQGRAAEAAHKLREARTHYEHAARYPTAYYGQLARARLGLGELGLTPPPALSHDRRGALARAELVRAAEILYALDQRDLVVPFVVDVADKTPDTGALVMIAELTDKHDDARAMLLIGKAALARGHAFEHYAFPTIGLPDYKPIGPEVEPAIVYSIARQESGFNPHVVSSANALGLMQVTPPAGRFIAKKFNVTFDQKRLLHDSVYNVQMGAAELGDVIERYRGSYILAFVAYNAGPGRAKDWIERFGDPRDQNVDPIDWVERIPFSETRNYVQRALENVQVYRARFGGGSRLMIEADLRRGGNCSPALPVASC